MEIRGGLYKQQTQKNYSYQLFSSAYWQNETARENAFAIDIQSKNYVLADRIRKPEVV